MNDSHDTRPLARFVAGGVAAFALASWVIACSGDDAVAPAPAGVDAAVDAPVPVAEAGASDGAGDTSAPLRSLADFLARTDVWSRVPGDGAALYEGRVGAATFPPRTWDACGGGCRVSRIAPSFDSPLYAHTVTGAGEYVGGEALLTVEVSNKLAGITVIERLSDGAAIAAAYSPARAAYLAWPGGSAPLVLAFGNGTGGIRFARVSSSGSAIAWQDAWSDGFPLIGSERFAFDEAYGVATYGALLFLRDKAQTEPIAVTPGSRLAHGRGPQLVWGYSGSSAISSFTQAGGQIELITLPSPRMPVAVRLSDDRIYWLDGVRPGESFEDVQWHRSPRATTPAGIVVHDGPKVAAHGGTNDMQATGVWAAADGLFGTTPPYEQRIFVWNTATGQTFMLPNRPGHMFERIYAVTDTELVVGERKTTTPLSGLDNFVRISLDALPALVAAWQAP